MGLLEPEPVVRTRDIVVQEFTELWLLLLTMGMMVVGFFLRGKFTQMDATDLLLRSTREEIAREHITRAEYKQDLQVLSDRLDSSFKRLEDKLDAVYKEVRVQGK
ncbi:MAG: hypothetical protein DDT25_00123 [Chloroflexi bacterium]|nr:hypothetical protein [Chloroflexota bacterium]